MSSLFKNPKVGDKVVLRTREGVESITSIYAVTSRVIRIRGCNVHKFNRTGGMHKASDRERRIRLTIKPYTEQTSE